MCVLVITGRNDVVAKVIFLHLSVILFTGWGWGCLPQCMLGYHTPLGADTPQEQTPPETEQTPPRADTPLGADTSQGADTPPEADTPALGADTPPPEQTPPWEPGAPWNQVHPLLLEADSGIQSTSGQYASYWNAFFFKN